MNVFLSQKSRKLKTSAVETVVVPKQHYRMSLLRFRIFFIRVLSFDMCHHHHHHRRRCIAVSSSTIRLHCWSISNSTDIDQMYLHVVRLSALFSTPQACVFSWRMWVAACMQEGRRSITICYRSICYNWPVLFRAIHIVQENVGEHMPVAYTEKTQFPGSCFPT